MTTNNYGFDWLVAEGKDATINEYLASKGWPTVPWWDGVKASEVIDLQTGYQHKDTVLMMTLHLQEWVIAKGSEAQIRLSERLLKDREQHRAEQESISGTDY